MKNKKKLLIITKRKDLTIDLFSTDNIKNIIEVYFLYIEDDFQILKNKIEKKYFDYIYIRDPFGANIKKIELKNKINYILKNKGNAYMIDNISSIKDIYLEDKRKQYKKYKRYMPITKKLNQIDTKELIHKKYIIKERISSMAKGIFFDINEVKGKYNNYIIQDRISIKKEYRIFVLLNDIVSLAGERSTKTENTKVKVIGTEEIPEKVETFLKSMLKKNKFDFIGVDIALDNDKVHLIEINRSCFFNAYLRHTGINLAEVFIKKILKKFT